MSVHQTDILSADASQNAAPLPAIKAQRARGMVTLASKNRAGVNAIARLRHQGSAKAILPSVTESPDLQAVLVNTAGGITGGDRFSFDIEVADASYLGITTQAAERIYRATGQDHAELTLKARIGPAGRLDWLPQETILFEGARIKRQLQIELADDAELLMVEPLVLGRPAMGEEITTLSFFDQWRISREGKLIYADALRLTGSNIAKQRQASALFAGNLAAASLLLISPKAEALLSGLRDKLGAMGGASLLAPDMVCARLLAADSFELRRSLIPALEYLRGHPLPRNWSY